MTTAEDRIHALPCWSGEIDIARLSGGPSSESWVVRDARGKHVVRFGSDFPFHHVIREREIMTAHAAHAAGFAPEVEYAMPGVMVSAFIEARTYNAQDVRANRQRIAALLRRFHEEMPHHVSGAGFMFWVFHMIRDYARTLVTGNSRFTGDLPGYLALADELERAQVALPVVFGHNDLLPANFLDDGDRLWLIDFEYAGFSTAMFDLAGLSSNAGFDREESAALLEDYFGEPATPQKLKALEAMQCASLLREAMWSMVSEIHLSAPGVDYDAYTQDTLARLDTALDAYVSRYGKP